METLREYRVKANISQHIMADILKTTRSQVTMAERGERPLPKEASIRFKTLQRLTHDFSQLPLAELRPAAESETIMAKETVNIWIEKIATKDYEHYKLTKLLSKMKSDFEAFSALRLELFKAAIAIGECGGNQAEVDYFNDKQMVIQRKILTCGRIAQLRLQLSIDLLLAEASLLNQYLISATAESGPPM